MRRPVMLESLVILAATSTEALRAESIAATPWCADGIAVYEIDFDEPPDGPKLINTLGELVSIKSEPLFVLRRDMVSRVEAAKEPYVPASGPKIFSVTAAVPWARSKYLRDRLDGRERRPISYASCEPGHSFATVSWVVPFGDTARAVGFATITFSTLSRKVAERTAVALGGSPSVEEQRPLVSRERRTQLARRSPGGWSNRIDGGR